MGGGLDDHIIEEDLSDVSSCVIEGTLIQTIRGSIPVEWIEIENGFEFLLHRP